jgi:hypothetical protein
MHVFCASWFMLKLVFQTYSSIDRSYTRIPKYLSWQDSKRRWVLYALLRYRKKYDWMTSCIQFISWCFADLDRSVIRSQGNSNIVNPQYSLHEQGMQCTMKCKYFIHQNHRRHLIIALLASYCHYILHS